MPHGKTLELRALSNYLRPTVITRVGGTYVNPDKDRSLPGKKRIRARRGAKSGA